MSANSSLFFREEKRWLQLRTTTTRMACAGATCGDLELREIPLALPREEGKDAGDAPPSNANEDGEEDDLSLIHI